MLGGDFTTLAPNEGPAFSRNRIARLESDPPVVIRTYPANSLIIPMDLTYPDLGAFRAYGLVYKLLAGGVPVDWTVRQDKLYGGRTLPLPRSISVSAHRSRTTPTAVDLLWFIRRTGLGLIQSCRRGSRPTLKQMSTFPPRRSPPTSRAHSSMLRALPFSTMATPQFPSPTKTPRAFPMRRATHGASRRRTSSRRLPWLVRPPRTIAMARSSMPKGFHASLSSFPVIKMPSR